MDIFNYYLSAKNMGLAPALLEFGGLRVCGIKPETSLGVTHGHFFKDSVDLGLAEHIFEHLHLKPSHNFFPAYLGFFSYEFAQHLGFSTKDSGLFPDAFFNLYTQGLVIKDGQVLHHDPLPAQEISLNLPKEDLVANLNKPEFFSIVENIKERIKAGDNYQVNFSMPFYFKATDLELCAIYQHMRQKNPLPFMGLMSMGDWQVLSLSPERLFSLNDGNISARPIAGTKKRQHDKILDDLELNDLKTCPKENAEHAMLVDLMRNDLNQVAEENTVVVDEDRTVEFYSHVMHLVSNVSCQTKASLKEIFSALFPGGTITGAPKQSVMDTIAELEATPRGPYTGSFGYISGQGLDFNILIRSIFRYKDQAYLNAGAGIVIDSDPESEWQEIHKKAQAIKDILANKNDPKPRRDSIIGPKVLHHAPAKKLPANVLFFENNDSFSFNIIDALKSLGAQVKIAKLSEKVDDTFTHVVIGPGPGNPQNLPELSSIIDQALALKKPLLGICLGHQAIGYYFKSPVKRLPMPIHGQAHEIFHNGQGLFNGVSSPTTFARYHSLVVSEAPADFTVDTDGEFIMALRHKHLPIFGVQFHPESYLSTDGLKLLENFLVI